MKYYIETYGCALAEFDSALAEEALKEGGHERVSAPEGADCIFINTCAVRLDTEQRIADRLRELSASYPNKAMVVMGCLAKARPGLVARAAPRASLLAPQAVGLAREVGERAVKGERVILLEAQRDVSQMPAEPRGAIGTIMIQEGCLGNCSFCITKIARRQVKSYPPRVIVEAVERLVSKGAKEIRLTGVDVAVYGIDLPGRPTLADLLFAIVEKVEGEYMIRVGMMTPDMAIQILDDLLDAFRSEKVYKHFHLPVQSGDNEVLKIMNRSYTVEDYKDMHRKIKLLYPDSMIATDIIVGHPGESEEAFMRTVALVEELRFEKIHLAQYTIRPHTRAAALPQVADSVKKRRSTILMELSKKIGEAFMSRYLDRTVAAITTEPGHKPDTVIARLENYVPLVIEDNVPIGKRVRARITGYTFFDIRGEIVDVL